MVPTSPNDLEWEFSELPPVEEVPPDAYIIVWDLPSNIIGLMYPWGDSLNPTRWNSSGATSCIDGVWTEQRGKARYDSETRSYVLSENGKNLVQFRYIRKPVWWAWVSHGTADKKHEWPTWREVYGPREERDWE